MYTRIHHLTTHTCTHTHTLSLCLSLYLSVSLFVSLCVCLCLFVSVCLCLCLSVCLCLCLCLSVSFHFSYRTKSLWVCAGAYLGDGHAEGHRVEDHLCNSAPQPEHQVTACYNTHLLCQAYRAVQRNKGARNKWMPYWNTRDASNSTPARHGPCLRACSHAAVAPPRTHTPAERPR